MKMKSIILVMIALGCGLVASVGAFQYMKRPNAVAELGIEGATQRYHDILSGAIASIPSCPGEAMLAQMVNLQARKLTPSTVASRA